MFMKTTKLLYEQICNDLNERIKTGQLVAGEKLPGQSELQQHYQVSHITILRVYKELVKTNVIEKHGRGYRILDKNLTTTLDTNMLGVFVRPFRAHNSEDNFFNEINLAIENTTWFNRFNLLRSQACAVLNGMPVPVPSVLEEIARDLRIFSRKVRGLIIDDKISDEILQPLVNEGVIPIVIVNRKSQLAVDTVSFPISDGIETVLQTAQKNGYQNIIYCGTLQKQYVSNFSNYSAFLDVIQNKNFAHFEVNYIDILNKTKTQHTNEVLQLAKKSYKKSKTLIFSHCDRLASQHAQCLIENGLLPGKDIGLCGFGGMDLAFNSPMKLATVKLDATAMGNITTEILFKHINNPYDNNISDHSAPIQFIQGNTM
jgi:DNA-binding LacI/PurR family transcriptional regulator